MLNEMVASAVTGLPISHRAWRFCQVGRVCDLVLRTPHFHSPIHLIPLPPNPLLIIQTPEHAASHKAQLDQIIAKLDQVWITDKDSGTTVCHCCVYGR